MTSTLRWAAIRAILMFHNCEGQSHKTVSQTTTFEEKGEPKQIRTEVPLLTSLTPYRYAKPAQMSDDILGTSCDQCRSMVQYSFTSTETRRLVRTDSHSPGRPPRLSHVQLLNYASEPIAFMLLNVHGGEMAY